MDRPVAAQWPTAIWLARLAITSLAFMLVCVPEPVWNTPRKLVVPGAVGDFGRGGEDQLCPLAVDLAEHLVGLGGGALHQPEGADHDARPASGFVAANREVQSGTLGGGTPQTRRGYRHDAEGIVLVAYRTPAERAGRIEHSPQTTRGRWRRA